MATQTANLGLTLPIGSEKVKRQVINSNNEIIDAAVGKIEDCIAYRLGETNTTGSTLAVGTYVYVSGNSTLAEGLYTVSTAIGTGITLSASNCTAVSGGGLNALNTAVAALGSNTYLLKSGSAIPNNTNINTVITPGSYSIATNDSAVSMTNLPVAVAGTLHVSNAMLNTDMGFKRQIYMPYNSDTIYSRCLTDGVSTWSTWDSLALNSNLAKIDSNSVTFWSTLSTQKYQGKYFAQIYGNFKGKTLTLTGATAYNGTAGYNILSTSEATKLNDFCVNIATTSDSVGGTLFYVSFSVS